MLVDAAHIRPGDHLLLGRRRSPVRYRVRHVEYHGGRPAYWRVRLERPLPSPDVGEQERSGQDRVGNVYANASAGMH